MDLAEQNELVNELEKVLRKKLKKMPFHATVAVADEVDTGFAFSITTLTETESFQKCRTIIRGIGDHAQALIDKFEMPSDVKLKKPLERK